MKSYSANHYKHWRKCQTCAYAAYAKKSEKDGQPAKNRNKHPTNFLRCFQATVRRITPVEDIGLGANM